MSAPTAHRGRLAATCLGAMAVLALAEITAAQAPDPLPRRGHLGLIALPLSQVVFELISRHAQRPFVESAARIVGIERLKHSDGDVLHQIVAITKIAHDSGHERSDSRLGQRPEPGDPAGLIIDFLGHLPVT